MRRKTGISIRLGLLALLLCAVAALSQESQYKIRAKVDLVVVPVTVKGTGDKLATGLTQQDFVISEDGRRQTISNFTNDPVPLSAAVVVDTGLMADSLAKVQQTFPALAGAFSHNDEVALYQYDKFVTKNLDFSTNSDRIETAMKKLREVKPDENPALAASWRGPFANPGPVINGAPVLPPSVAGPTIVAPQKPDKVLHDALFDAAADLGKRERNRRKMILVISDGVSGGNQHTVEDVKQLLLQTGVEVYAVAVDQPFPYSKVSVLDEYTKTTGGDAFFVRSIKHLERAYMQATEEARNQYVIGYISNNDVNGPGPVFRELSVQVLEGKFKTLHRKGYFQYP